MRPIRDLTLILLTLAGALLLSQLPGFVAAYEQRLGGALDEARRTLSSFAHDAASAGLGFSEYVGHLKQSTDPSIASTGITIQALADRVTTLSEQQAELVAADKLRKPILLASEHDPELLRSTWADYRATPSLDLEFGAIGLLLGWLLNTLVWALLGPKRRYA